MTLVLLSPVEIVLNVARSQLHVREDDGSNRSQAIDAYLRYVAQNPKSDVPWCAAFVTWCIRTPLGDHATVPRTASCYQVGAWGKSEKLLDQTPAVGSMMLHWYPKKNRYAHIGLVTSIGKDDELRCIEGNTNDGKARVREGWGVFEKPVTPSPGDAFVHWWKRVQ